MYGALGFKNLIYSFMYLDFYWQVAIILGVLALCIFNIYRYLFINQKPENILLFIFYMILQAFCLFLFSLVLFNLFGDDLIFNRICNNIVC